MLVNAVVPGILLLGLVIFVHELGHFLMAKWRGVRVLRFSLGFGPALFSFTRGETEYRLSWIPLGGYVQMAGDSVGEDGSMPGARDEFLSHPWYGRIMIAAAGPAANLVTAFVVIVLVCLIGVSSPDYPSLVGVTPDSSLAYRTGFREGDRIVKVAAIPVKTWMQAYVVADSVPAHEPLLIEIKRGDAPAAITIAPDARLAVFRSVRPPATPAVVGSVRTGMPAYKAGIKEGDRILAVNDVPIASFDDLPIAIRGNVDKSVKLKILRDGRTIELSVTPMNSDGKRGANGQIGIAPPREEKFVQRYPLQEAIKLGATQTVRLTATVYQSMWLTVSQFFYYREYVGGPLFIAQAASESAKEGLDSFLQFLAMINIAIMAFNLMPLPVLDGGHILLALIEAVRRQAVSARTYVRFQQFGLVIMGTLLVLILANDPWRVVQRQRAIGKATPRAETAPAPAPQNPAPEEKTVAPTPP